MNTEEFIKAVKEETRYSVNLIGPENRVIEISFGNDAICRINILVGLIHFRDDESFDMDDSSDLTLLSLLHEYCLAEDRKLPDDDVTISKSEYEELYEKAERFKELESVLTGGNKGKLQGIELPF